MENESQKKTMTERLVKVSGAKWLCLIIGIMVMFFYVRPIGFPVPISQTTKSFYDAIEALPENSVVGIQNVLTPTGYAEQKGQVIAIYTHLFARPLKLVFFNVWVATSPPIVATAMELVPRDVLQKRQYGKDYVIYGYVAGEERSMAAIGNNFWDAYPVDTAGTPTSSIPMMSGIRTAKDFAIIVHICAMFPSTDAAIRVWIQTFKVRVVMAVDSSNYMALMPYYPAIVPGILNGVRGGAEYEILIKRPGPSLAFTDAISGMAVILIGALFVGNVLFYQRKKVKT